MIRLAPLLFLALLGCPPPDGAPGDGGGNASTNGVSNDGRTVTVDLGETLAQVDGVPVGAREFAQAAARRNPGGAAAMTLEERQEVLEELINNKALYLEARRQGIDQDPKVQRQMVQILLRRTVYNQVKSNDFTDEDLRAFYETNRDDFIIPEKVRARRIFIKAEPTRSKAEAEELAKQTYAAIDGNIDVFVKQATQVSEGPFRGRGGDMGLFSRQGRAGLSPAVVDKAFSMEPGTVSEPFFSDGGYHIIATIVRRDQVERTFEQMKGAVLRRAKGERQKKLFDETVAELRKGATVEINTDKLESLDFEAMSQRPPMDVRPMEKRERGPRVREPALQPLDRAPKDAPGGEGSGK